MKNVTQSDCDRIAYALNTRPRKRHCYKTPEELYYGKDSALHLLLEPRYFFFILISISSHFASAKCFPTIFFLRSIANLCKHALVSCTI
jgi:hypothetical protein